MANELYHHGILGMRWGVRRTPEQLGHRTNNSQVVRKRTTSDSAGTKGSSSGGVKKTTHMMTDEELRSAINRLQLEKQYKDLTKTEVSAGKKWVMSVLSDGTKKAATNYVNKTLTKLLDSITERNNE